MNKDHKNRKNKYMEDKEKFKIAIVGILTGLLCGLFASGGGLILVPAFVYIFKQSEKKARAMSVLCILPMVLASLFFYNKAEYIDWRLGIICGIGGIIGGVIGANLMKKINDKYLILIFIASYLLIKEYLVVLKGSKITLKRNYDNPSIAVLIPAFKNMSLKTKEKYLQRSISVLLYTDEIPTDFSGN